MLGGNLGSLLYGYVSVKIGQLLYFYGCFKLLMQCLYIATCIKRTEMSIPSKTVAGQVT